MSYPLLVQGDRLPSVGVVQKLLNARNGNAVKVDGVFGRKTERAVVKFQEKTTKWKSGIIDELTWKRLAQGRQNLKVIDCIDVLDSATGLSEARMIRRSGGKPILIPGMSGGVDKAISEIIAFAGIGKTFLLRFHGHGNSGVASMGNGMGLSMQCTTLNEKPVEGIHGSEIHSGKTISPARVQKRFGNTDLYFDEVSTLPIIRKLFKRLAIIFGVYGCIEFMHCNVAKGIEGRKLMRNVSVVTRVPTSGSPDLQYGGGRKDTFRLEGKTYTHFPPKQNLRIWSSSRLDFF